MNRKANILQSVQTLRALAVMIVMLFTATTAWAQGSGTSATPYEISTYAGLKQFSAIVNGGNTDACAVLTADIVCKNGPDDADYATDWTPIGNYTHPYTGTFDGRGYTITGLSTPANNNFDYVGLFGYIGSGGFVKNVILEDATITGNHYVGAIVGSNNNGTLTDNYYRECSVNNVTTNVGTGSGDCNGARGLYIINLPGDVTAATAAITNTDYYVANQTVTLSHGDREGYIFAGYTVTKDGTNPAETVNVDNNNQFTMPASDVTVSATFTPDIATHWHVDADHDGSTPEKAYIISTTTGLNLLASEVNGGNYYDNSYFVLANDITYSTEGLGDTESNYTPIGGSYGSSIYSFCGTFDGQGHTVSGIRIYRSGNDTSDDSNLGLFGAVSNGNVKNVTVSDMRVTGYCNVGGIVGENLIGGKIVNCHATATVALHALQDGASSFGGVVGNNNGGLISGCSSAVTLTVTGEPTQCKFFGGIVGDCNGDMRNCLSVGVRLPAIHYHDNNNDFDASGAIAGKMSSIHAITDNYYSGCYLDGTPTASGIGAGNVTSTHNRNDVTSFYYSSITYTNCAVPTATLRTLTVGTGITAAGIVYPHTTGTDYSVIPGTEVTLGYNVAVDTYQLVTYSLGGTPLKANTFTMPDADATATVNVVNIWNTGQGADGSAEKPFIIKTTQELDELAWRVNNHPTGDPDAGTGYSGKYFELGNDITYSTEGLSDTQSNFTPIGIGTTQHEEFRGNFDGKNHTVSGIRIYRGGTDVIDDSFLGLFGCLNSGTVQNVTVSNAIITGYWNVGGIVGYNSCGTVKNCHVTSAVVLHAVQNEAQCFGGIAGRNFRGTIDGCTSAATIGKVGDIGDFWYCGGLVGYNDGITEPAEPGVIKNCFAIGANVTADDNSAGAIVGFNTKDTSLSHNYYHGCTLNGVTASVGCGIFYNGSSYEYNLDITANDGARLFPSYTINSWGYNCTNYEFPENTSGVLKDDANHEIAFSAVKYREERVRTIFIERDVFTAAEPGTYQAMVNDKNGIPVILTLTIHTPTTYLVTKTTVNTVFHDDGNKLTLGDQINPGDILDFQDEINQYRYLVINKRVNIISSNKNGKINLHTIPSDIVNYIPKFSFVITSGAEGSVIKDVFVEKTQTWMYHVRNVALENMTIDVRNIKMGEGIGHTAIRYCDNITIDGCTIITYNTYAPSVVLYSTNYSVIKNTTIEGQEQAGALLTLDCPNEVPEDVPYENYVLDASHNSIINCLFKSGSSNFSAIPIANNNADYTTIDGVDVYANLGLNTGNYATLKNSSFHNACSVTLGANSECYNNKSNSSSTFTILSGSYVHDNEFKRNVTIQSSNVRFENNTLEGEGTLTINSGSGSTITDNAIVTTQEYAVELKSAGNTVTGNSLICSNHVGDAAVKIASGKTNTVENNTGGTPITNATTTLAAGDNATAIYYVPANTMVSIGGNLAVTGNDGQKAAIMLFEGAQLNIGGKIDAAEKQLNIYARGSETAMGEMVVSGAIESAKLYIGSGRVTARSTTAEVSYNTNTVTTPSYITLSGEYKGYFTCGGTSHYIYDASITVSIDAPGDGYANCGIEVDATPEGTVFKYMTDHGTMSTYDVTINAVRYYTNGVPYIDAGGTEKTTGKTYVLTGWDSELGKSDAETWYLCNRIPADEDDYGLEFVNGDPTLAGNVHLILGDRARMTVGYICGNDNGYDENATRYALHIYGQHLPVAYSDADDYLGQLVVQNSSDAFYNFSTLAIHGGSVICEGEPTQGQNSIKTNVFAITGGHFDCKGYIGNDIGGYTASFDWTSPYDCYKLYGDISNVSIAENKVLAHLNKHNVMFYLRSGDGIITELATITPYGYGGYCGKTDVSYGSKLTWDVPIDKTTLTIKGNGAMRDYDSHAPWSSYGFTYANIDAGVSSIGNNAFEDCDDMTLILVPDETTYAYFAENWTDAKRALLAPREIPMAMNSSHWVTYCHNYPVGYGLSQGLTAYTVNGLSDDGQSVGTTAVTTVYPGTPVLLSSNENLSLLTADPTKPATPATTDIVDNGGTSVVFYGNVSSEKKQHTTNGDGIPALTAKNGLADGWTCYALYNGVFQLIDTDGGISPNRCVLAVNTNGQAAARSLTIGEGTTSLREVNRERVKSEVWYALDGRKLNGRPTKKGLYINGGRKVVIK